MPDYDPHSRYPNVQGILGKVLNDNRAGLYFTAAYLTVLKNSYGRSDNHSMYQAGPGRIHASPTRSLPPRLPP